MNQLERVLTSIPTATTAFRGTTGKGGRSVRVLVAQGGSPYPGPFDPDLDSDSTLLTGSTHYMVSVYAGRPDGTRRTLPPPPSSLEAGHVQGHDAMSPVIVPCQHVRYPVPPVKQTLKRAIPPPADPREREEDEGESEDDVKRPQTAADRRSDGRGQVQSRPADSLPLFPFSSSFRRPAFVSRIEYINTNGSTFFSRGPLPQLFLVTYNLPNPSSAPPLSTFARDIVPSR